MKNEKPLISVIVPVYNGQDYLEKCIESIEGQTYSNLEIIIVNDGSTDNTSMICDRLRTRYGNIRILPLNDRGVSAARNAALGVAKGELISFVDADDRLCPRMLGILYGRMMETGSDVAGCRFFSWGSEEEWEWGCKTEPGEDAPAQCHIYNREEYLKEAILKGNSRCWSKLYRRQVFDKARFLEGLTIGEDLLFLVRMLACVEKIVETDYPGYGYFQNPSGAIQRGFTPGSMDQITCWKLVREEIMRMDPSLDAQVGALLVMGIMLTAGKLAVLPAAERRKQKAYVETCHRELKKAVGTSGVYGSLSVGYRVKAAVFLVFPELYLGLYHWHKEHTHVNR